jgi:hypothetical protein
MWKLVACCAPVYLLFCSLRPITPGVSRDNGQRCRQRGRGCVQQARLTYLPNSNPKIRRSSPWAIVHCRICRAFEGSQGNGNPGVGPPPPAAAPVLGALASACRPTSSSRPVFMDSPNIILAFEASVNESRDAQCVWFRHCL